MTELKARHEDTFILTNLRCDGILESEIQTSAVLECLEVQDSRSVSEPQNPGRSLTVLALTCQMDLDRSHSLSI